jgi:hypothetical protein
METLHADLIPHADDEMVYHPLVIADLTIDASRINHIYRQKIELLAKAEADGDWSTYVFLHERPYRLGGLLAAPCIEQSNSPVSLSPFRSICPDMIFGKDRCGPGSMANY